MTPPSSYPAIPSGPPSPGVPQDAKAFDDWLRQELSRLYDAALTEPVPEDLLRLLRSAGDRR
jgi:hypothetical protein